MKLFKFIKNWFKIILKSFDDELVGYEEFVEGIQRVPPAKRVPSERVLFVFFESNKELLKNCKFLRRTIKIKKNNKGEPNLNPYKSKYYSHDSTKRWFFWRMFGSTPKCKYRIINLSIWKGNSHIQIGMKKLRGNESLKVSYFIGCTNKETLDKILKEQIILFNSQNNKVSVKSPKLANV